MASVFFADGQQLGAMPGAVELNEWVSVGVIEARPADVVQRLLIEPAMTLRAIFNSAFLGARSCWARSDGSEALHAGLHNVRWGSTMIVGHDISGFAVWSHNMSIFGLLPHLGCRPDGPTGPGGRQERCYSKEDAARSVASASPEANAGKSSRTGSGGYWASHRPGNKDGPPKIACTLSPGNYL
jgi:hypothetical protein